MNSSFMSGMSGKFGNLGDPRNFDPSKMDPKLLMELSRLVQQLPPEKLSRMQTLMHNMMAGFDVKQELEAFEQELPAGFREKLFQLMMSSPGATAAFAPSLPTQEEVVVAEPEMPSDLTQARRVILRAVADGRITPEEAEKLLFEQA